MEELSIRKYQEEANRTTPDGSILSELESPDHVFYFCKMLNLAMGLCGEAGEVSEQVKKHVFHGHDLTREKLSEELGDILWYWVEMHTLLGLDPVKTMAQNVAKLTARYPNKFCPEMSKKRNEVDTE